jgi:hypothetical protein
LPLTFDTIGLRDGAITLNSKPRLTNPARPVASGSARRVKVTPMIATATATSTVASGYRTGAMAWSPSTRTLKDQMRLSILSIFFIANLGTGCRLNSYTQFCQSGTKPNVREFRS